MQGMDVVAMSVVAMGAVAMNSLIFVIARFTSRIFSFSFSRWVLGFRCRITPHLEGCLDNALRIVSELSLKVPQRELVPPYRTLSSPKKIKMRTPKWQTTESYPIGV